MKIQIKHVKREHERLLREHGVSEYLNLVLRNSVGAEQGIIEMTPEQYHEVRKWKAAAVAERKNIAEARRPHRPQTPPPPPKSPPCGVGTELKKLLSKIGMHPSPTCACNARAREMDEQGIWWCKNNVETINGWMKGEAHRRKLPYVDAAGKILIRRAIKKAEAAGAPYYAFNLSSTGLGDAICGLYAACGLADSTGRKVLYYAHSATWINRASHPNVEIRARIPGGMGVNACADMKDYGEQIASAETRVKFYTARLSKMLGVKPFSGTRPKLIDTTGAAPTPAGSNGVVVIAPYCCFTSRDWDKYTKLALEIEAMGYAVVGIGSATQANGLASTFQPTRATYHWGKPPQDILPLLLGANLIIGNDSGIPHLGGLLGVPTISIHAGCLSHDFLFENAPSVRSVTAGKTLARSDNNPEALRSITVEAVMKRVRSMLGIQEGKPTIADAKRRTLLGDHKFDALMRTLASLNVAGDAAELGVYRGGSAAGMALTAPQRTVYAFDTFEGMPELAKPVDVHKAGEFNDVEGTLDFLCRLPNVSPRRGIFPGTATGMEEKRFALVHLDGDLYESTIAGLEWFWPRLSPGGKIVLDDWEWPRCPGVKMAVEKYFAGVPHLRVLTAQYQLTIEKV